MASELQNEDNGGCGNCLGGLGCPFVTIRYIVFIRLSVCVRIGFPSGGEGISDRNPSEYLNLSLDLFIVVWMFICPLNKWRGQKGIRFMCVQCQSFTKRNWCDVWSLDWRLPGPFGGHEELAQ